MNWRLKGAVQKVLGHLPRGDDAHFWLQSRLGGLRDFDRELAAKLEDFALMIGHLRSVGLEAHGRRFCEVGSGWYPTFPFCLYLLGASQVTTYDLNRYVRPQLVRQLVAGLGPSVPRLAELGRLPRPAVERRYARLVAASAPDDFAAATDGVVRYHAPADATATGLPAGSVDVQFSNSVLEHVPAPVIDNLYREAARILAPGGVMFHSVNCGDHYAYVDRRINQLNYLQYPARTWAKWNNAFLYQNRLRAEDFTRAARAAGFAIDVDTSRPHPTRLEQLRALQVAPEFARYTEAQLAITSIDFIARLTSRPST